jgi:dihydrolipoamide dehydrogenase
MAQKTGASPTGIVNETCDLAVIGGGPGGYVAAICGARKGLKTILIEKDALGGTCLNRGCIPTKSLIYDTKRFKAVVNSALIKGSDQLSLQTDEMFKRKTKVVKILVSGVSGLVKSNGATIIEGEATLEAPGRISIANNGSGQTNLSAKHIILANGSKPAVPTFIKIDGKRVQTTDEILSDPVFPESIVIIGGGVIGIEMAAIFLNAGAKVTVIEMLADILLTEDIDVRAEMRRQLKKQGATVLVETSVTNISQKGSQVTVTYQKAKGTNPEQLQADKVLVATGRAPNLAGIDSQQLGLEMNGPFVKVNSKLETNLPGVYAIGDLIGGMMLAHKASTEAEAVVDNILGAVKSVDPHLIPRCIWGLLEVGALGMSEEEAIKSGRDIKVGRFPFIASGAARAMDRTEGFVKIIGDVKFGEILGVHIIGEHATDLIAEAVTLMKMEGTVEDLCEAIKPHPTLSETVREAALDWNKRAIHLLKT